MPERDLANCLHESAMYDVVNKGAQCLKQEVHDILPPEYARLFDKRALWIHDMEFYRITYNCIGVNPSQLFEYAPASFGQACRELFRGIIALTNQQSGGIGLIDFDSDMASYVGDDTDTQIEDELYELLLDLNTYVRKGCERAYVTINFGLDTSKNARRLSRALLNAFCRKQFVFPNMGEQCKRFASAQQ